MASLPPLNALRAFEAAARLGSFTRAAEELFVTQAAISQQVKLLEQHLKTPLFIRQAKGLELTDAGQNYRLILTQVFHSLRTGTQELFGERGRTLLSIKVANSFAEHFLCPRLPRFIADYPNFRVRVVCAPFSNCSNDKDIDLEICNGYGDWENRQVERLTQEDWLVVCRPETLKALGPVTSAADLLEWPKLMVTGYRETWSQWFESQGVHQLPSANVMEFETSTLALQTLKNSNTILLVRSFLASDLLNSGQLVLAHPGTFSSSGSHYMIWRKGDERMKITAFSDWIRRELRLHHKQNLAMSWSSHESETREKKLATS